MRVAASIVFFSLFFVSNKVDAQVNESVDYNNTVYPYLYRMSQKGIIRFDDYILPLDRKTIAVALLDVAKKDSLLSHTEKVELNFYLQDFYFDIPKNLEDSNINVVRAFKKDQGGRWRVFYAKEKDVQLFIEPNIGAVYTKYKGSYNGTYYGGGRFWGNIGKNFGFNVSYQDITETGDSLNRTKYFTPETGIINTSRSGKQLNYSNLVFNIGYTWKTGSITVGKDHINWGYGESGRVVISSKAPSFPYLRFDFKPFKWFSFNYFHGWLNSDVIDSSASYNTNTGTAGVYHEVYRSKFIASHTITITPTKGLDISVGESMIYSDKVDFGYLIPINFFKLYDQYSSSYSLNGGSNGQFFGQISSKNQIKNIHLYATLFVDEIRFSKIFDNVESRNQIGYTLGANRTDLFIRYLTLGVEYSKIRGGVYNNLAPTQTYENNSYVMGDWMGQNADRIYVSAKYTPFPKFKINSWFQYARKGSPYTLQEQYFQQPEPPFLNNKLFDMKDAGLSFQYEWLNSLKFLLKFETTTFTYPTYNNSNTSVSAGFSYGF